MLLNKKIRLLIYFGLGIIFISNVLISQIDESSNKEDIKNPLKQLSGMKSPTYQQIKDIYEQHWSLKGEKSPAGWKQYKRWEHFWETRLMPDGSFPNGSNIMNGWNAFKAQNESKKDKTQSRTWELIGPVNVPEKYNDARTQGLGRINVVRFDPQDSNTIWAGSASGGLWKSTDQGATWNTFPFTNFLSMGISDIAVYTKNPSIVYVATGDDNGTYAGGNYYSIGLIKTYYGGLVWEATNLSKELSEGFVISRVLVNPDDFNIVIVGTSAGILKSTDGGKSWETKLPSVNIPSVYIKDMEFMIDDHNIINATSFSNSGQAKFYRSTDNGDTWEMTHALNGASRIAITVSESNPDKIWAVAARAGSTSFHSYLISEDRGATWELFLDYTVSPNILGRYRGTGDDELVGQGNYDLCIAVNPDNEEEIYVGGINIWKSDNGGNEFERLTLWYSNNNIAFLHADQHDLTFKPGTNQLFSANDGGLYRTDDYGDSWAEITDGMSITQYYRMGQSKTNSNLIIGGCQDNGTNFHTDEGWKHLRAGDGMECAIHPKDDKKMFMTYYWGSLHYSKNYGEDWYESIIAENVGEAGAWVTPFVIDETNPNIMYVGFQNIYKSMQGGLKDTWDKVSDINGQTFRSMAIAPGNTNVIYAATYYDLYASYDAGNNWEDIYHSSKQITYIAVHPENPNRLWLTLGGFYEDSKVIEINDSDIKNISGNLPNVPVNCIVYQGNSPDRLYIGTDIGVFYSDYNSAFWESYGEGLPNTIVNELEIFYPTKKLRAATYGRGFWETDIMDCNIKQPEVTVLGETEFCEGDTLILEAEPGYSGYEWTNGDTTRIIKVTESGAYSVRVFDDEDCFANSEAVFVNVKSLPDLGILNLNDPAGFCENDSIRLTASLGFKSYEWSTGETGRNIYVSIPGIYWVSGTASNDCERKSEEVEIFEFLNPPQPSIEQTGNKLTVLADGVEVSEYVWYFNGEQIEEANLLTYTIKESGLYSVKIIDINGCSAVSEEYDMTVGIEDGFNSANVRIYPNPGEGEYNLVIQYPETDLSESADVGIEITNILGEIVFNLNGSLNPAIENIFKINLQSHSSGIYFVKINIGQYSSFHKLVKK
ncbi:T9SS type A sorting domain-containing protein [Bacteroidota bacterium]